MPVPVFYIDKEKNNMKYGPPGNTPNFYGEKDYQKVARDVFPRLIQLATDDKHPTIYYEKLAEISGVTHIVKNRMGHWMRHPLGSIWQTLFELQKDFDENIPYLTTIVVNKNSKVPTLYKSYLEWSDEDITDAQRDVYMFKRWTEIMKIIL